MGYAQILAGIAVVHLLAIASPGPTFVLVASYSMRGDRRAGLLVTLGVLLATLAWSSLAAAGLIALLARWSAIYRALQFAGAAYLVYLGARMLIGAFRSAPAAVARKEVDTSPWQALRAGFITNITNPKVIAYYASLFGVMVPADAPPALFLGVVLTALATSAVWWSAVAMFFAVPAISRTYANLQRKVDGTVGVVLILLGLKLAIFD
jgi:threonine efflux protein